MPSQATCFGRVSWSYMPMNLRGQNGRRFTFYCPGGSYLNSVWGTDIYTDNSSVCSAAVHAGVITAEVGGNVTIEIRPRQAWYQGSTRNGVTTRDQGPSATPFGSFVVGGGD